jgi:hypothetical protein
LATEKKHRAALLCLATLLSASSAAAQSESAEDKASARVLGTEGVRLAESGDCAAAIPKFEAAEKLYHAPTTLERLGECQVSVGKLVEGTENLNRLVREPLPPGAPPAFVAAVQRGQKILNTATPRIARLRIHVDGPSPEQVKVTIDGANVPSALLDADRPTDPGSHAVKAVAPGFKDATYELKLLDGQEQAIQLKLEVDPNAQAAVTTATTPVPTSTTTGTGATLGTTPRPATTAPEGGGGSKGPAIGAFAVGAAGVVVGAVFGAMALSTKSTLDTACVNMLCPSSSQSNINTLGTEATVSTIGFGVGIVGAVLGVVFLVTSHGSSPPSTAVGVTPWMGIGSSGLGGAF